ncbi:argonaute-like protein [Lactarius sanguifluus]|nr:argonaute-like protein [Lactarius sanguifluus]
MPPKPAPEGSSRGRGRRRGRGRGHDRGGGGDRRGWRGRGRGSSSDRGGPSGPPGRGGDTTRATPFAVSGGPAIQRPLIPAIHVTAISVKRPGHGTGGRPIEVFTNSFQIELNQGTIHHYNGMCLYFSSKGFTKQSPFIPLRCSRPIPVTRNFKIIRALQTRVAPELFARPGVYDGRKNLFTAYELPFESGGREISSALFARRAEPRQHGFDSDHGAPNCVCLFNPAMIHAALNVVVRTGPNLRYPFNVRSFLTSRKASVSSGIVLWRRYFQSVRPAIGRIVINIDISTGARYRPRRLIDVALAILGRPGNPNALAPRRGLPDRERIRLQQFFTPGLKKLSKEGARDLKFELTGDQTTTVADYFRQKLNRPLRFPDVICVELSSGTFIPLELCRVSPRQIVRKQVLPDKTNSVLQFATKRPNDRLRSIISGLGVLDYNRSEYVREFGMTVANEPIRIQARVLGAPTLRYHQSSREPRTSPRDGAWNFVGHWMIIIYERQLRFNDRAANDMAYGLVRACQAIGISINPRPALIKWESVQGNVGQQLRAAGGECQRRTKNLPTLVVVVLPEGSNDIYSAVKHFGDVATGVVTQCMKSSKCLRERLGPQYYASITLKLNVKLGGVNTVPEPCDISFLTNTTIPTIVMGAYVIRSALGSGDLPSFASLVGSIDTSAVQYVSTMEVQTSRQGIIDAMESMSTYVLAQYKSATGMYPERILLYRKGVSERQFVTIIEDELPLLRRACKKLGFNPTITLIIVSKRRHVRFFPRFENEGDRSGNCPAGTVIDSDVVNPVEFGFYLQSHGGVPGTARPTRYNVLVDENRFTADGLQALSYALCHVYARATRSVSIPAPVYYAKLVCSHSKHHFDPQLDLTISETATDTTTLERFRKAFRPTHERQKKLMYFC